MSKDINVTDGTVLETLNNKVDLDGGNYPGSGLEEYIHEHCGGSGLQIFDTILKDHVLTYEESKGLALQGTYVYKEAIAGSRYGYPDFYNKCLEEQSSATATEVTLGSSTITMYIASNGHQYYDIASKDIIDTFYNTMGYAWFYGVDTENERIFLPRNNWFEQATALESEVGQFIEAGLPNITGTLNGAEGGTVNGAFKRINDESTPMGSGGNYKIGSVQNFDASRSNSIYGNSNTVQPNAIKKLLYICVGNTEKQSSVTDVIDVTTTENDTIPLGYSTYQANVQPSISWLKSQGQWNDGNVYTTFYNEFVQKIGQAFASGYVREITEEYDDYDLVINQDDMTFRLPLLDGSESLPSGRYKDLTLEASGTDYTAPANGYVLTACAGSGAYMEIVDYVGSDVANGAINHSGASYIGGWARASALVKKGDIFRVFYGGAFTKRMFRFVYAQGNGSLYFKVANAVQNLELLNAGEVLEAVNNVVPNNSSLIAEYALPSKTRYVDLVWGATGTIYTAPANGWLYVRATSTSAAYSLNVEKIDSMGGFANVGSFNGYKISGTLPIRKGEQFSVAYANVNKGLLRFIYAEGDK